MFQNEKKIRYKFNKDDFVDITFNTKNGRFKTEKYIQIKGERV